MKSTFLKILSLAAFGLFLSSASFSEVVGRSIATVNGEAIFLSEFKDNWETLLEQRRRVAPGQPITGEFKKEQQKELLDHMIEERLLIQEAKKKKVKVQRRQLEEGIRQVKNRFKNLPPGQKPTKQDYERDLTKDEKKLFLKELSDQDLTEDDFEKKIEDQLRIVRLTEEEISGQLERPFNIDDLQKGQRTLSSAYEKEAKELYRTLEKKYYDKAFKPSQEDELDQMVLLLQSKLGEAVQASHILIKTSRTDDFKKRSTALNTIKAVQAELKAGADFEDLARQKSEGPSGKNGGDLGFFSKGQMVPEFEKAAFSARVGEVTDIVETEFGYHLIKVTAKRAAQKLKYDDIKLDLASYLYQKKSETQYKSYVSELRKRADINVATDFEKLVGS